MNWFEEQIKYRSEKDSEALDESLKNVSATIEGKKRLGLLDDGEKIKSAIDDVFAYYGAKPCEIPVEIKGLNDRIEYVCRPNGIMFRTVKLEKNWYRDAVGAFLGKLKTGEAVAIIPDKFGKYGFFDPTKQKRIRINGKTQELLEEEAYCFYRPFPLKKIGIPDLIGYIISSIDISVIIYVVLMTLAATMVGMITPRLTQILFSDVLESKSIRLLLSLATFYVCTGIGLLLVNGVKNLLMNRISTRLDVSVQAATMARVLSLPANFFKDYNSGEVTARAMSINSLCSSLVQTFLSTGITSLFSLLYITQVFVYAKELVIPSLCITLATLVFSIVSSLVQMKISKKGMELSSEMNGRTYQILTGVQKIKLSGSEKRVFARWLDDYTKEAKLTYNPPKFILFNGLISTAISLIGTMVMYFFAVKSGVSVADYTAFNSAYGMLSGALMSVASIALTAARIKPMLEMAKPVMEAEPEISENKQIITKISGNIELSRVSFRYTDNSPLVVDDLSLKIKAGQYIAIVGKTGCGKSTLLRLLLGFEKPQKGAIYYDGRDIETVDLRSLRKKIGVVTQNGKLFQGDIYSNIVISAPYLSVDDAWKAAEVADIAEDIRKMPMGMHTIISEGAGGISGGQKQRLMIARAVAPNPKILMFDEATSALDNITQKKVSEALDGLKCTRIVIAHRLSTIKQCDRIIVLDGGKIVGDGTYDELLAKKGYFYELVERQRLDK